MALVCGNFGAAHSKAKHHMNRGSVESGVCGVRSDLFNRLVDATDLVLACNWTRPKPALMLELEDTRTIELIASRVTRVAALVASRISSLISASSLSSRRFSEVGGVSWCCTVLSSPGVPAEAKVLELRT
mmetsp:Transcript_6608/g.9134  ORF Transcript_6608/g.9134 Transcript_6608/m.9134 type:complete len:130 (+) Transcript_6608:47-436(+)